MSARVDPSLMKDVKEYGAVGIEKCFNCGNCTAICPLTSDDYPFPRNIIRLVQVGQKDRLIQSLDPWLCYYCGDCSETCPKGADPGESMMSMRRWLSAQYDWTGLARKFYTSKTWEIGSVILLGLFIVVMFALFHGPVVTDRVELNTFAPVDDIHLYDWIMAGFLMFFIGTNILRMYNVVMRKGVNVRIPISSYLYEIWNLVVQFATQKRWTDCTEDTEEEKEKQENRRTWFSHLLLAWGYVSILVLVMFFLPWFQTDKLYPIYNPLRWIGYLATIALLYGTGRALWGRFKKDIPLHQFSHASDWLFPILLLAVTITGILVHIFRYQGWALATYYIYVIHLALAFPMLVLEVPFGKWSHLYYRPLAIYFQKVKARALEQDTISTGELSPAD
jgi:ferredoxin